MVSKFKFTYLLAIALLIVSACNNGTSSVTSITDNTSSESNPELFMDNFLSQSKTKDNQSPNNDLHTVQVKEILNT